MELTAEQISTLGGVIVALVGQAAALIKFLDAKTEKRIDELTERLEMQISAIRSDVSAQGVEHKRMFAQVNDRINGVKDTYTKRSDHDKDFDALVSARKEDKAELKMDLASAQSLFSQAIRDHRRELSDLIKGR